MSWIEAFKQAASYLPLAVSMYAVCWVIFCMGTWVLLQAWEANSLLFIVISGAQFFSGTILAAGATIAIGVKVISDTSRSKREAEELP